MDELAKVPFSFAAVLIVGLLALRLGIGVGGGLFSNTRARIGSRAPETLSGW